MTLLEAIATNEAFSASDIVYAARRNSQWWPDSEAQVVHVDEYAEDDPPVPSGMMYFLEIFLIREVIDVFVNDLGKSKDQVTDEKKFSAVLHYAENDAYLPVD